MTPDQYIRAHRQIEAEDSRNANKLLRRFFLICVGLPLLALMGLGLTFCFTPLHY